MLECGGSSNLSARGRPCHRKGHLAKMLLAFLLFGYFGFGMIGLLFL